MVYYHFHFQLRCKPLKRKRRLDNVYYIHIIRIILTLTQLVRGTIALSRAHNVSQ